MNRQLINKPSERVLSIQYLRGIAAIMVVMTHSSIYLERSYGYHPLRIFFDDYWSYFGVIIFFTISGFLLTSLVMKTNWKVFLLHRFARIFPLYIICLVLTIVLSKLSGIELPQLDWRVLLLSPIGPEAYRALHVEWTLIYEMAYYVLLSFFCIAIFRKHLFKFYIAWLVMLAAIFFTGSYHGNHMLPNGFAIYLTSWNIAFIFGGLGWLLCDRKSLGWSVGLLGVVCILVSTIHPMATTFLATAGVAILLAQLVQREKTSQVPFRSKVLERLGNWSYAAYLVHVPILLACLPIFLKLGRSPLSAWFSTLGIVLFVSACLGEIDLMMYRRLKHKIDAMFMPKNVT